MREVDVSGGQSCNERIFKCLNGTFCRADPVVVWWLNELHFTLVLGQDMLDVFSGLIVLYVELWCKSFCCEIVEIFFVCLKYRLVIHPENWVSKDAI